MCPGRYFGRGWCPMGSITSPSASDNGWPRFLTPPSLSLSPSNRYRPGPDEGDRERISTSSSEDSESPLISRLRLLPMRLRDWPGMSGCSPSASPAPSRSRSARVGFFAVPMAFIFCTMTAGIILLRIRMRFRFTSSSSLPFSLEESLAGSSSSSVMSMTSIGSSEVGGGGGWDMGSSGSVPEGVPNARGDCARANTLSYSSKWLRSPGPSNTAAKSSSSSGGGWCGGGDSGLCECGDDPGDDFGEENVRL